MFIYQVGKLSVSVSVTYIRLIDLTSIPPIYLTRKAHEEISKLIIYWSLDETPLTNNIVTWTHGESGAAVTINR